MVNPLIKPPKIVPFVQSSEMYAPLRIWGYCVGMKNAFHTDPLSSPAGDVSGSGSEFWGADLALRIWIWLSQICAFSMGARQSSLAQRLLGSSQLLEAYTPFQKACRPQPLCAVCGQDCTAAEAREPFRHDRRMIARRARGIRPVGRYTLYNIMRFLPQAFAEGLSRRAAVRMARRLVPLARYIKFLRSGRVVRPVRKLVGLAPFCAALLSPD